MRVGPSAIEALLDTNGNKAEAARPLGSSRATIYRKIHEYGISMPDPVPEFRKATSGPRSS